MTANQSTFSASAIRRTYVVAEDMSGPGDVIPVEPTALAEVVGIHCLIDLSRFAPCNGSG